MGLNRAALRWTIAGLLMCGLPTPLSAQSEDDAKLAAGFAREKIPQDLADAVIKADEAAFPANDKGYLAAAFDYLRGDKAVPDAFNLKTIGEDIAKPLGAAHPLAALIASRAAAEEDASQCTGGFQETEREATLRASLAALQAALPGDHPGVIEARINLARFFQLRLRFDAAEPLIGVPGENAALTMALGMLRRDQGRYDEGKMLLARAATLAADPILAARAARALALVEITTGGGPDVEKRLNNALARIDPTDADAALARSDIIETLGDAAMARADFALARTYHADSFALIETKLASGGGDPREARKLASFMRASAAAGDPEPVWGAKTVLCTTYGGGMVDGRMLEFTLIEAQRPLTYEDPEGREKLFAAHLALAEKRLGPDHPALFESLFGLANIAHLQGRDVLAETLARRAVALGAAKLGVDNARSIAATGLLGTVMQALGRTREALALLERAAESAERALGPAHPGRLARYADLARFHDAQGKHDLAEPVWALVIDAMASLETLEQDSRIVWGAQALENQIALGKCPDDTLFALAADHDARFEKGAWGAMQPQLRSAMAFYGYAEALFCRGRFDEAVKSFQDMDTALLVIDNGHPQKLIYLARRAMRLSENKKTADRAASLYGNFNEDLLTAARGRRALYRSGNALLAARSEAGPADGDGLDIVFQAYLNAAWRAIQPRLAKLDQGMASDIIREVYYDPVKATAFTAAQDLQLATAARAQATAAARARDPSGALSRLVAERQTLAIEAIMLDQRALAAAAGAEGSSAPAQIADILARLATLNAEIASRFPDYAELANPVPLEIAAVQTLLADNEALMLLMPSGRDMHMFAVSKTASTWQFSADGVAFADARIQKLRCALDNKPCDDADQTFDQTAANELYDAFIAPLGPVLGGVKQVFVVASGAFSGLPLSVLRTGDAWLGERHALTTLPAVSSLALRAVARAQAPGPYLVGFGDPVLSGANEPDEDVFGDVIARGDDGVLRADPSQIRSMKSLPGTRIELNAMAASVSPLPSVLRLGTDATETAVKRSPDLAEARIVVFATHGVLPRAVSTIAEPGLIFSPPDTASDEDDGLLTASEAAALRLTADLVMLSACNTASADGRPGGESLSGLARAFFYAGAGGLLATHWAVSDAATAALTSELLRVKRADETRDWASALQQAENAIRSGRRADGSALPGWKPAWSQPRFWAPFVYIGNGG